MRPNLHVVSRPGDEREELLDDERLVRTHNPVTDGQAPVKVSLREEKALDWSQDISPGTAGDLLKNEENKISGMSVPVG